MKPLCAAIAIPVLLLVLGSCRTATEPESKQNSYAEYVSRPALERRLASGELVIGLVHSPETEKEFQTAAEILSHQNLKLKVIYASRAELPPLLRSGAVDLIAGGFSEKEILDLHLIPIPSSPDKKESKNHVFAIRRGNPQLEKILSDFPSEKGDKRK